MIDQDQNQIPAPAQTVVAVSAWKNLFEKVKTILTGLFNRLYSNKKIFWLVSTSLGLIFLVILLGLVFGRRGTGQNVSKLPTPFPVVQTTPQASASSDILINSQNKLNDLKNQINNLDVKQSRLKPPVLNFDIKF